MRYKALIFDIDGTAVENAQYAKPSARLIETVGKAKDKAHIVAATGRLIQTANWIIKPLGLVSPCIVAAGAQIIDPKTGHVIWEKSIPKESVDEIFKVASFYPFEARAASQLDNYPNIGERILRDEAVIYISEVPMQVIPELLGKLEEIEGIVINQAPGYEAGKATLSITQKDATKKHATEKLLQILKINKEEVAAVGDGKNDLPLFEAAGFKIAMGNASDEFKSFADYVAPSVSEDGLAQVIEKFIEV